MSDALFPELLEDCTSDQQRMYWLLTTSLDALRRDENEIRAQLRRVQHQAGVAYLDAELISMRAPRRDDGTPLDGLKLTVARGRANRIACGLPLHRLGD
jgi:hypothetical protein